MNFQNEHDKDFKSHICLIYFKLIIKLIKYNKFLILKLIQSLKKVVNKIDDNINKMCNVTIKRKLIKIIKRLFSQYKFIKFK